MGRSTGDCQVNNFSGLIPVLCAAVAIAGCGGDAVQDPAAPIISIAVSPRTATVGLGQSIRIAATVDGTDNAGVVWSVSEGAAGSVAADGTFTATGSAGVYHVVATSAADPSRSDRCEVTVTLAPQVIVTVSPATRALLVGASTQFTATVSGSADTAVTWSVTEAGGGVVGATGTYVAPSTPGTYHVVATSRADPTRKGQATATVTATPGVSVVVSPKTKALAPGATFQFLASVSGAADTAVNWSVTEAGGGSVGATGTYVAPATPGTYHVVATARADTSRSDSAAVTVAAPATDLASQFQVLSTKALLFGHQSVGNNILAGVGDLLAANPGPEPARVQGARSASQVGVGIWGDFGVGANIYPAGKVDDFVAVMNGGAGAKVDIAFMKFCFVDFYDSAPYWTTGTVDTLFAKYRSAMAAVRAANPNVTIVHFTVPLVNAAYAATNDRREALSNLMRSAYAGTEPVFDLALLESTRPDGTRCLDGRGIPLLCAEYSLAGDDGHLNSTAKPIVARALVSFLAAIP